ncbi:MAG: hypothetical protein FJ029_10650 [Actinobacteria bacterium]|nr:hypothetical protein [Actinomycetota bacterium]
MILQDFGPAHIAIVVVAITLVAAGVLFTLWSGSAARAMRRAEDILRRIETSRRKPVRRPAQAASVTTNSASSWQPPPEVRLRLNVRPNPRHLATLGLTTFEAEDSATVNAAYQQRRAALDAHAVGAGERPADALRRREESRALAEARKSLLDRLGADATQTHRVP